MEIINPEDRYSVLVLLGVDPRVDEVQEWVNLDQEIMGATIQAWVVPHHRIMAGRDRSFLEKPIHPWEEPNTTTLRASSYLKLIKDFQAEAIIRLGWPYHIPGPSEAGVITISPLSFTNLSSRSISFILRKRLHGSIF
jgi:hypothetical protein